MKNLIALLTGSRRKHPASLRDRWVLFKWTVEDSFHYLFVEDSPWSLREVQDDLFRMEKMNPKEK